VNRSLSLLLLSSLIVLAAHSSELPEGAAKKTVEQTCSRCHTLDVVTAKRWSRTEWEASINAMVQKGATLSASQTTSVVEYLSRNFGKKERGRQLVEDICTYCHNLDKLNGQQMSREEWRDLTKGMIFEGAPVTEEEFSTILDYLAKYYGPKGPEE
jgi:cytochrome c5